MTDREWDAWIDAHPPYDQHHCAACDELHGDCICPQLPIDTEDQP